MNRKTYVINVYGYLVDLNEWDKDFAEYRALEMGIKLGEKHWKVINFIRDYFFSKGKIPGLLDTCIGCGVELCEFEKLFPDGYNRMAVKIAGLNPPE